MVLRSKKRNQKAKSVKQSPESASNLQSVNRIATKNQRNSSQLRSTVLHTSEYKSKCSPLALLLEELSDSSNSGSDNENGKSISAETEDELLASSDEDISELQGSSGQR